MLMRLSTMHFFVGCSDLQGMFIMLLPYVQHELIFLEPVNNLVFQLTITLCLTSIIWTTNKVCIFIVIPLSTVQNTIRT